MPRPRLSVAVGVKTKTLPLLLLTLLVAQPVLAQGAREELVRLINAERSRAGSPPLRLEADLNRAAQGHAEEVARRGSLEDGSSADVNRHLQKAGYQAHEWTENMIGTGADPGEILSSWRQRNPSTFRDLMRPEYRDLGIGISRLDGTPLYNFLFAVPQADYFQRETSDLRDIDKVRQQMLAQVNTVRKEAGLRPLRGNTRLDRAAQGHAEDMLARGFFAHESPSGATVSQRSKSAGYLSRAVGENIAFGQISVAEVMETWMDSPGHRKNILTGVFTELGTGLAFGRDKDGKYQVYWVQNFGTPRGSL